MSVIDVLCGRPLPSKDEQGERLGPLAGIPVFGLDALSSAAYGPEAALALLISLGAMGVAYIVPITISIIALLLIVYFSYRQTIAAYPQGGGSYTVAGKNLGPFAGLLAAAALMIDYVLTAAVGISAGVGALVSAIPSLEAHTLALCLAILVLIILVNLRGARETGVAFMIPTYLFLGTLLTTIILGVVKSVAASGHPVPVAPPAPLHPVTAMVSAWLLLKAFASGCTAMTGVEAVSNGVTAFREPVVKSAQRTLTVVIGFLMVLLAGIAYLCRAYQIGATEAGPGYQSVLSQLIAAVVGRNAFYYLTIAAILLVLSLSANTAFADFPRLCRLIAEDGYLPNPLAVRGRRLVYTAGIAVLGALSGALLILFRGVTDRLIPLYAVGAFLAFTLSQAGMVAHWKRTGGPGSRIAMLVNGLGAVATHLGFQAILGAFIPGAILRLVDADAEHKHPLFHPKLDAIGYGFLIPVFFVTSGLTFNLSVLFSSASTLLRVPLFLLALLVVAVRKLSEWLATDALVFEFLFVAENEPPALAAEQKLLQTLLREAIAKRGGIPERV